MRLMLLARPLRPHRATCNCCQRDRRLTARFYIPASHGTSAPLEVDLCSGCLGEARRIATTGRKREDRS